MPNLAGTQVAERYDIEAELGRGGMATVWRARDLRHERTVAIKVLHPELAGAIGTDRFVREVRLTARLQHPNIVPILDSGVLRAPDGTSLPWYAMAFLEGESLRERLEREPQRQLPIAEALAITEAVGAALQAAHQQGIVHRDIKPENIYLSSGHVYVVDFGIAKALIETGAERLTSTGLSIGTPAYMSPEQATGDPIDARTDQYSLATVLYEMLAGEPPFSGPSAQATVARRLVEPARPLRPVRSSVPEPLERAILRGLERAAADRYSDVSGFTTALRAEAVPRPAGPRAGRLILAAVLLLVTGIAGWLVASRSTGAERPVRDSATIALYRRGLTGFNRRTPAGMVEAVAAFNAAVERDSSYGEAWAGLAKSYVRAYRRAFTIPGMSPDHMLRAAVVAADRALGLDSMSADAWVTRAMVATLVDPTDLTPSFRAARRALALDSTNPAAWHAHAVSQWDMGDYPAGAASWRQCIQVSPAYGECLTFLALVYYWRRQYDSAMAWVDSAIAVNPSYFFARQVQGNVAVERGEYARAVSAFDAALRLVTDVEAANSLAGGALAEARAGRARQARALLARADSLARAYRPTPLHTVVYLSQASAALGDRDRAVALLAGFEPKGDLHFQMHLRCDPPFDPVRSDRRFQALLLRPDSGRRC